MKQLQEDLQEWASRIQTDESLLAVTVTDEISMLKAALMHTSQALAFILKPIIGLHYSFEAAHLLASGITTYSAMALCTYILRLQASGKYASAHSCAKIPEKLLEDNPPSPYGRIEVKVAQLHFLSNEESLADISAHLFDVMSDGILLNYVEYTGYAMAAGLKMFS